MVPPTLSTHNMDNHTTSVQHSSTEHVHRRYFIGPIPEKVIAHVSNKHFGRKGKGKGKAVTSPPNESDGAEDGLVRQLTLKLFIREGGRAEELGEQEEISLREEVLRRWKDTEWGSILSNRPKKQLPTRWIGGSFEVGDILGINLLEEARESMTLSKISNYQTPTEHPETTASTSFTTTSHLDNVSATTSESARHQLDNRSGSRIRLIRPIISPVSGTARTERFRRSILKMPHTSQSDNNVVRLKAEGEQRVHYNVSRPSTPPNSPGTVLERSGEDVEDTSAGAMTVTARQDAPSGDIVMRDRMLVQVNFEPSQDVPIYDEKTSRTMRNLRYEAWKEFSVVWRRDRIELYDNYAILGTEWAVGHKHLAFIVPLDRASTRLWLYSFVDISFSISCRPTATHRYQIWDRGGTQLFVFKTRSRSRACDWLWHLWRHLGGDLPPTIEVWNPSLDVKVKIDLPDYDTIEGYKILSRHNLISLCTQSLKSISQFKNVVDYQIQQGKTLQLAWRIDTTLDWIWLDDTVFGLPRQWEVLYGLAMKQSLHSHLEIRLASHTETSLRLSDGKKLTEPFSIEGYLDRIRPTSLTKDSIYLSTHDGYIFMLPVTSAQPPTPFGLKPITGDLSHYAESFWQDEAQRGTQQLRHATGALDLRNIIAVRRAFQPYEPRHSERERAPDDPYWDNNSPGENIHRSASDGEDEGGEEATAWSQDKLRLRMRRSFELLLKSGHVIRYEAHSCKVAVEWIDKLRDLMRYWLTRHRIDAHEEMELAQSQKPRVTPLTQVHKNREEPPEPPVNLLAPLPALGSLFNWCVLEACKPILKGGKIYTRHGLRGHYQLMQAFLISGNLVHFHITPKSSFYKAKTASRISLVDAYVLSGFFAAQVLPRGQINPANDAARRYHDGLENDDMDQERLFVITFHRNLPDMNDERSEEKLNNSRIPKLSQDRSIVVFYTRSKLERDSWCWAINSEIERVMRKNREREEKVRDGDTISKT